MRKLKDLWRRTAFRRVIYLCVFGLLWQLTHAFLVPGDKRLMFPSVPEILTALVTEIGDGSMLSTVWFTLRMILQGIGISALLALIITPLCMASFTIKDMVRTLISVLDPLPGIALLPLTVLWFGIGQNAILFVMVHSVLWPMLLNVITGFDSVPLIYQEVGRSFGLSKLQQTGLIYAPAAFPSILTGIKTGWSRAWRALISAEMVFGAQGAGGGMGWDLLTKRSFLDMPGFFASLIVIMLIGILVEELLFNVIEKKTLVKWGVIR